MITIKGKDKVAVIVQVMDIFNKIDKFEEIPEEKSEEYKEYEKEEYKAYEKTIEEIINDFKQKGYKCVGFYNREEVDKKLNTELALGINGIYLLIFKKCG
jgi:translation initiation factor IF-2